MNASGQLERGFEAMRQIWGIGGAEPTRLELNRRMLLASHSPPVLEGSQGSREYIVKAHQLFDWFEKVYEHLREKALDSDPPPDTVVLPPPLLRQ